MSKQDKEQKRRNKELLGDARPDSEFGVTPSQKLTLQDLISPLKDTTSFGYLILVFTW
jgi:hypothetical protein